MYAAITSCHAIIVVDLTCLANHPTGAMGAVPIYQASELISQLLWTNPNCDLWCHFGLTGAFPLLSLVLKVDGHERRGVILVDFQSLVQLHLSTGFTWLCRYPIEPAFNLSSQSGLVSSGCKGTHGPLYQRCLLSVAVAAFPEIFPLCSTIISHEFCQEKTQVCMAAWYEKQYGIFVIELGLQGILCCLHSIGFCILYGLGPFLHNSW